jgi:MFS family permease
MVGAPSIQSDFAVSYLETSGALLIAPLLVSFVLEPALLLLADRHARARNWFIAGGLLGMAIGALACAIAPNALVLTIATSLSFVATGLGVSTAQATLVDAFPGERERIMTRWAMLGVAGDLAAPLLLTGLAALSVGWRGAYALVGGLTAIWAAIAAASVTTTAAVARGEDSPGLWTSLVAALQNRRLLAWLFGAWLCCLLDEILVVFGSLYLRDHLGAGLAARGAVMAGFLLGGAVGLAATDRLLERVAPRRLLVGASTSCAILFMMWMAAPSLSLSALAGAGLRGHAGTIGDGSGRRPSLRPA